MSQYIVIGHRTGGLMPVIHLETNNEDEAAIAAHNYINITQQDVYVFDTSSYQCILALTHEPEER